MRRILLCKDQACWFDWESSAWVGKVRKTTALGFAFIELNLVIHQCSSVADSVTLMLGEYPLMKISTYPAIHPSTKEQTLPWYRRGAARPPQAITRRRNNRQTGRPKRSIHGLGLVYSTTGYCKETRQYIKPSFHLVRPFSSSSHILTLAEYSRMRLCHTSSSSSTFPLATLNTRSFRLLRPKIST